MSLLNKAIAGLAGSVVLTATHQLFKNTMDDAPNLDHVGEEALQESLEVVNAKIKDDDSLFTASMAGNILGNAVLFSSVAATKNASKMVFGTIGATVIGAGGSMKLADKLLPYNDATNTSQKRWMTSGYYILGALVSIGVYNLLEKK